MTPVENENIYNNCKMTFEIVPIEVRNSDVTVTVNGEYTYTGSAITPDFTVSYGGKTLIPNKDYTYELSNNVNAGKPLNR